MVRIFVSAILLLCTIVSGSICAQDAQKREVVTIRGQVIDPTTKQPIVSATVLMFRTGGTYSYGGEGYWDVDSSPQSLDGRRFSALTDESGRFSFRASVPDGFRFHVRKAGYLDHPRLGPQRRMEDLAVKLGEAPEPVIIALDPECSVSGVVVDRETNKPIAGIDVTLVEWQNVTGARVLDRPMGVFGMTAKTNQDGSFEIKGVRPGEYSLEAMSASGARIAPAEDDADFLSKRAEGYVPTYYPNTEYREAAGLFSVLPGAAVDRLAVKIAKRPLASIRGRIFADGDAASIGDVTVGIARLESQGGHTWSIGTSKRGFSAGAQFQIDGLPPGTYLLSAKPSGDTPMARMSSGANPFGPKPSTGPSLAANVVINIAGTNIDGANLQLSRGATVHGKVQIEEKHLPLLTNSESLPVYFYSQRMGPQHSHQTGILMPMGTFKVENLADDSYLVWMPKLSQSLGLKQLLYNGHEARGKTFVLNTSALEHQLTLVLEPATASLAVTVNEVSRPVENAIVLLVPNDLEMAFAWRLVRSATTGKDGRAQFTDLVSDKYHVLAFPPNTAWLMGDILARNLRGAKTITLSEGSAETIEVRLINQP